MNNYKVAIYIRLSKEDLDKTKESESITNQRNLLMTYLEEHDYILTKEYVDDGYSGTTFDRPGFNQLIKDIEDNKINMVITKDLSRLGRDYIQSGYYIEQYFPAKKVRYISILDSVDTFLDTNNNDIAPFKSLFNDMQSKDTSKKIRSILKDKKKQGLFLGNSPSFGYKKDPKDKHKLIIDHEVSPVVKRIFTLALEGNSVNKICFILNKEKIITPSIYKGYNTNKRHTHPEIWTASSVYNILKNRIYTGDMVQGIQKKLNYKSKKRIINSQKEWIVKQDTHEAIISKEVFEIVNRKHYPRSYNREKLLLEGLVYCQECGCLLGAKIDKRNPKNIHWTMNCNKYTRNSNLHLCVSHFILYSDLEDTVLKHLKEKLKGINDDFLTNCLNKLKEKSPKTNNLISEQKKIEGKIKKLYNDFYSEVIPENVFKLLLKEYTLELDQIKNSLQVKKIIVNDNDIIKAFKQSKINRELLFTLIDKIAIDKEKNIEINYKFRS